MTTDFSKPDVAGDVADDLETIKDNVESSVTWLETIAGVLNIPTNAKTFNTTNQRFEKYNGSSWVELLAMGSVESTVAGVLALAYNIRVAVSNVAVRALNADNADACSGNAATATTAANSTNLGGVASSLYTLNSTVRGTGQGGTGASTVENAQTNLDVYGKAAARALFLQIANDLSEINTTAKKLAARGNLDVYAKADVYTKTEIDSSVDTKIAAAVYQRQDYECTTGESPKTITAPTGYRLGWMGGTQPSSIASDGESFVMTTTISTITAYAIWVKLG